MGRLLYAATAEVGRPWSPAMLSRGMAPCVTLNLPQHGGVEPAESIAIVAVKRDKGRDQCVHRQPRTGLAGSSTTAASPGCCAPAPTTSSIVTSMPSLSWLQQDQRACVCRDPVPTDMAAMSDRRSTRTMTCGILLSGCRCWSPASGDAQDAQSESCACAQQCREGARCDSRTQCGES